MNISNHKITVCRKEHFNAAHRLHNNNWDDNKNKEIFGLCNNANYHGHNYELIVKVSGYISTETGYLIDMKLLSNLIKKEVLDKFDHKNLNLDTLEFKNLNPTAENIAITIHQILQSKLDKGLELQIILYETERNYVEYPVK